MAKITLTEGKLREMIAESVKRVLSEVSHGYVQDVFNRVDNTLNDPNNKRNVKAKINPKKTPEQIAAQKERITNQFNKMYGSNEEGNTIQYDFNQNNKNRYLGKIQRDGTGRELKPMWKRGSAHVTNNSGGVTINGKRYTLGDEHTSYLTGKYEPDHDDFDYYGSKMGKKPTPVAIDSDGNVKHANEFTPQQIAAFNNVSNKRELKRQFPDSSWNDKTYIEKGENHFK